MMTDMKQEAGNGAKQYQAQGDMVVNHYESIPTGFSIQYKRLVEEFEKELKENNTEYTSFIGKIKHYTSKIDDFIGLEEKLREAGYEDHYKFALRYKEMYWQLLTENDLSKATQKIHAFILARVSVLFILHIKGAINNGVSKEDVNDLIFNKVIFPIQEMLGENNVLDLYDDDIMSMIYFLTGNCHIRWI